MFKRSTSGAGLLVGTAILAVYATPAHAATIKWRVGPLELAAGQAAEVGMSNTQHLPLHDWGPDLRRPGGEAGRCLRADFGGRHIFGPEHVPAGHGLVVGINDSNETPGPRKLVQARVQAACPAGTDAQVRRLPVAMTIVDRASGRAGATLQGVAQ